MGPADLEAEALKAENAAQAASQAKETLEATIKAAELYLQALRITDDPTHKKYLDSKCKHLVQKAEAFKARTGEERKIDLPKSAQEGSHDCPRKLKEPKSSRELPKSEQILLWRGSNLNGFKFPPWETPPAPSEFESKGPDDVYVDLPELHLSSAQLEIFDGWKRPHELRSSHAAGDGDLAPGTPCEPTMRTSRKMDFVQDLTTDCSVVASLCAGSARAERGHYKLLSSHMFPYDVDAECPMTSPNGKYVFRLHFNGCARKVVVDDRLPASKTSRALHIIDRNNPGLLWPALLEKAYLKVRGGYDFPGSNSGTDIWIMTNWIPEQIFLHQDDVISDEVWKRIFNSFKYGDVLLTLGTGKLSCKEERQTGLAAEHDYAVLDLREEDFRHMVLAKNPWAEGSVWKGYKRAQESTTEDVELALDRSSTPATEKLAPGSFWMNFNHVFQYFESLYLNWNPGLFSYRQDIHFAWDLTKSSTVPGCLVNNPQYSIKSTEPGPVWLLLSRHFRTGDYVHTQDQEREAITKTKPGFISLYAFNKGGERIFLSDGAIHRGSFVDSPNTLLRFEMPPSSAYTTVVLEQSLPRSNNTFTLSMFSLRPISLSAVKDKHVHSTDLAAAWTLHTAGGNTDSPLYTSNPQFSFSLPTTSSVAILLECSDPDLPVHIKLFRTSTPASRVTSIRSRDIYGNSGDYRRGCAFLEKGILDAGSYSIVCSTFAKGQLAKFSLRVASSQPCAVRPLPAEGAGRLRLRPETAIFPIDVERLLTPLTLTRLTHVIFLAQHSQSFTRTTSPSPLKLSIELGQGPYKEVLAVSNEDQFSDAMTGIRIELDLRPDMLAEGGIWLVLQRLGSREEAVDIEVLSEERLEIGRWGTGSG